MTEAEAKASLGQGKFILRTMNVQFRLGNEEAVQDSAVALGGGAFKYVAALQGRPIVLKILDRSKAQVQSEWKPNAEVLAYQKWPKARHLMSTFLAGGFLTGDVHGMSQVSLSTRETTYWVTLAEKVAIVGDSFLKRMMVQHTVSKEALSQLLKATLGMLRVVWSFFELNLIPWDAKPDNFGISCEGCWVMIDVDGVEDESYRPNSPHGAHLTKIVKRYFDAWLYQGCIAPAWNQVIQTLKTVLLRHYSPQGPAHWFHRPDVVSTDMFVRRTVLRMTCDM